MTMPSLLPTITQVGDRKYGFRSDHLCILVLPCPHILLQCASHCLSMASLLLKLSGDVEENPGPVTDEILEQILQTQNDMLKRIPEIQEKIPQKSTAYLCRTGCQRLRKHWSEWTKPGTDLPGSKVLSPVGMTKFYNLSRQVDDL